MNDFDTVNMNKAQKAVYYLKEYGWQYTKNRALKKLGINVPEESEYMVWLRKKCPSARELEGQKQEKFSYMPEVNVLMDLDADATCTWNETAGQAGNDKLVAALEKSIKKQTYSVELVMGITRELSLEEVLKTATGEILVFAQTGVMLQPEAVYEYVKTLGEHPEAEMVYSDEDCGTIDGKRRMKPYFKPDIAPELLCNFQYIGGVFAVRRTVLERLLQSDRGADMELSGNGWYDLVFAATELLMAEEKRAIEAGEDIDTTDFSRVHPLSVCHLSKVLFTNITGEKQEDFYRRKNPDDIRFIEKHLERTGKKGTVTPSEVDGFFHVLYDMTEKNPMVSVLIATKDHTDDLDQCIQSLVKNNDYSNFEVVIAENNSEKPETFSYYEKLTGHTYDADSVCEGVLPGGQAVRVVTWKGDFNYSGINNLAAANAKGDLFLLLNNDTEIMNREALTEMVSSCQAEGVGGSGAMLYYEDGTIQHGGVVYKIGGFAANALWSLTDRDEKYYPYSVTAREMSCCTAACLMLKREAFEAVSGLDEKLCVALNDVDFCMRVRQAGFKIIFNPYAKLHHYESKSRGLETTPEKQERFNREIAYFQEKWQRMLDLGDPYYNVNQTLHYANYAIELAENNEGRYKA